MEPDRILNLNDTHYWIMSFKSFVTNHFNTAMVWKDSERIVSCFAWTLILYIDKCSWVVPLKTYLYRADNLGPKWQNGAGRSEPMQQWDTKHIMWNQSKHLKIPYFCLLALQWALCRRCPRGYPGTGNPMHPGCWAGCVHGRWVWSNMLCVLRVALMPALWLSDR